MLALPPRFRLLALVPAVFLATLLASGDGLVAGFSAQMFATGAVAVILCPLGADLAF